MGRSYTPKYRAQYRDQRGWQDISYRHKATDADAEKFRQGLNKSFQPGGVNYHLSEAAGYILHASKVEVLRNVKHAYVVATASAPMFEVF